MKRHFLTLGLLGVLLCTQSYASSSNLSDDEPSRQVKTSSRDSRVDPIVEKELAQHNRRIFWDKLILSSMVSGVFTYKIHSIIQKTDFVKLDLEIYHHNTSIADILYNSRLWAKPGPTFRRMGIVGMMTYAGYLVIDINDRKQRLDRMKEPPIDGRKNSPIDWGNGV